MRDEIWAKIVPHVIGEKGARGGNAKDTRRFVDGVLWVFRGGATWRSLPEEYGQWSAVQRRFCRWRDKGIWEGVLEVLMEESEYEWLMMNIPKAHKDARGSNVWPWMRMVCKSEKLARKIPKKIVEMLWE